jgi:hypothetical protein
VDLTEQIVREELVLIQIVLKNIGEQVRMFFLTCKTLFSLEVKDDVIRVTQS